MLEIGDLIPQATFHQVKLEKNENENEKVKKCSTPITITTEQGIINVIDSSFHSL